MSEGKAGILAASAKAVFKIAHQSKHKGKRKDTAESTAGQRKNLERGRLLLLEIIKNLASGNTEDMARVERSLRALHTRTQFDQAMLIRDLADICVTLHHFEQDASMSEDRVRDMFCVLEFLAEEYEKMAQ